MAKKPIKPLNNRQKDSHRSSIQVGAILNRLYNIGIGKVEADGTQVKAMQILLDKALPSLQSVTSDVTVTDQRSGAELRQAAIDALTSAGLDYAVAEAIVDGRKPTNVIEHAPDPVDADTKH